MPKDKFDAYQALFKQAVKPKLKIEKLPKIKTLTVALDDSVRRDFTIELGKFLTNKLQANAYFYNVIKYIDALLDQVRNTELATAMKLEKLLEGVCETEGVTECGNIFQMNPSTLIDVVNEGRKDRKHTLDRLIDRIENTKSTLLIIPCPFAETDELSADSLGTSLDILFARLPKSVSILLIEGPHPVESPNQILVFSPDQQLEGIRNTLATSLIFADENSSITMLGIIDDDLVEIYCQAMGEDIASSEKAAQFLEQKMEEQLASIAIDVPKKVADISFDIEIGRPTIILEEAIKKNNPGMIFIRNNTEFDEPLDSITQRLARHTLDVPFMIIRE